MSFKEKNYSIIKNAISYELANFCFNYFLLKRDAVKYLYDKKILLNSIELNKHLFGTFGDAQVENAYSHYADFVMETLLMKVLPIMMKETELDLFPTYSYARIYEKSSILKRHKDRPSCEISTTLNLGGDSWPIFIEPDKNKGKKINDVYVSENTEGVEVVLHPGDMLIYKGNELEHWRNTFEGNLCAQVFLHYNDANGPFKTIYDNRPLLGLPHNINV
jgi:hypothetical protein